MKKKILIIAGTRPEAIKMAPVYFALCDSAVVQPVFLATGQHREILHQALQAFGIIPDHDLALMEESQSLPSLTSRAITGVANYLDTGGYAAVLVQGDTTTVLASAIAAFYANVPLGHVEAGLRTHDFSAPWPEEMNRRLTAPLAHWNFCPTQTSYENLIREGIPKELCHITGNTVIDALHMILSASQEERVASRASRLGLPLEFLTETGPDRDPLILVTSHRRESFGDALEDICRGILGVAQAAPQCRLVYPVHANPNVRRPVQRMLSSHPQIALIEPCSYSDFVWLMNHSRLVLSDSGGVQEEAPGLGKPVLVLRAVTERPEGIAAGTCRLVGTDPDLIVRESITLLDDEAEYERRSRIANPYGDGHAAARIRRLIEDYFTHST